MPAQSAASGRSIRAAVLQLLQDIARNLEVQPTVTADQLRDLMKKTDLRRLTDRMEELAEPATTPALATGASAPPLSNATPRLMQP
jgi:hypothetical protein